jgi:hypothetical protein
MDYVTNKDILRMPTKVFCNKLRCFEQLEELYNKQLFNRVMIQLKQFCSNINRQVLLGKVKIKSKMETLPKEIQELVLKGVSDVKTGYFFKEIKMDDEYELPTYTNEKLYTTPSELVWGILETVMKEDNAVDLKEYESIRDDVLDQIKHCKDALSVCLQIKDCLRVYEQTEDLFIDIAYTSVF